MKIFTTSSLLLCLLLLSSCDGGSGGSGGSCASDQDLLESDCPAETLADICEPFFCGASQTDPPIAVDFELPHASCPPSDCFTLQCEDGFYTVNVEESEQQGVVLLSGLIDGDLEYFCFTRDPVQNQ